MPLNEEFEKTGSWLFRYRSYMPLTFLAIIIASFPNFSYPFHSSFLDELWEVFCLVVGFFGLVVRALTVGYAPRNTSGRNISRQIADTLNTTGMYSIVRNPLYLGNFFMGLAVALFLRVWWVTVIYSLLFALYYERIIFAEEIFLRGKFGKNYLEWASRTPAFIPNLFLWKKPELHLSGRTILRREFQSLYGLVISLFILEETLEIYMGHSFSIDSMWAWIISISSIFYTVVMFLHLRTNLLRVDGR
jgi:protein-S-isoprenylcysteine O-methyltransferase Ste14